MSECFSNNVNDRNRDQDHRLYLQHTDIQRAYDACVADAVQQAVKRMVMEPDRSKGREESRGCVDVSLQG